VPLISEGADENWFAARFGAPETSYDCDLAVQRSGGSGNNTPVGRFEDQAGLLFSVDTTGLTDVLLSFDWRTFAAPAGDQSVVGYFVGASPFGELPSLPSSSSDRRHGRKRCASHDQSCSNLPTVDPALFTELLRVDVHSDFTHNQFALPSNVGVVWVAFWHDGGENDYTKLDNVRVTANAIPEPSAALLLLLGTAGLALAGRKRT
jgi:hypothetical protein